MVSIQKLEDFLVGALAAVIFKNLNVHARRIFVPQTRGERHFCVNDIIVTDESPDEADYDGRRGGRVHRRPDRVRRDCRRSKGKDEPQEKPADEK